MIVAGALAAAHEHQAVHGDVRPNYLLVAPSGEPVLGGFGLSALAADPASGAPLPAHAAPEIVDGRPGDAVSDLYSLGSTLLTLLTGCGPEAALVDCLNRADELAGPSAALLPLGADGRPLPQGVVDMLARMTATDPQGRPADARCAALVLRATAQEMGLSIPEPGTASSPPSPHGGGNADDAGRIIEPQLTVLFDAWDKPAVTGSRVPRREPAPVLGAVPHVPFVPPRDIAPAAGSAVPAVAGLEGMVPAQSARAGTGSAAASEVVRSGPPKNGWLRRRAAPLAAAAVLVAAVVTGVSLASVSNTTRATSSQPAADRDESAPTANGQDQVSASTVPPAIVGGKSDGAGRAAVAAGGPGTMQQDSSVPATDGSGESAGTAGPGAGATAPHHIASGSAAGFPGRPPPVGVPCRPVPRSSTGARRCHPSLPADPASRPPGYRRTGRQPRPPRPRRLRRPCRLRRPRRRRPRRRRPRRRRPRRRRPRRRRPRRRRPRRRRPRRHDRAADGQHSADGVPPPCPARPAARRPPPCKGLVGHRTHDCAAAGTLISIPSAGRVAACRAITCPT